MISLPDEIVNHIFRYCQSFTNQIMKEHIENINTLNKNENANETVYSILQLNMDYGYIHFHFEEFKND
jgi:hypothetical protein